MKPIVEVSDLKIRHYRRDSHVDAVRGVNFSIREGEFISLCGLNGSGKTSLLSAMNGLVPHFYKANMKGTVMVDGLNTRDHSVAELSQKIGFVFDNPFNQISYTTETVRHEVAFGLCNQNIERSEIESRVEQTAELVGITHLLDRSPLALSGGQLQRIAIASVIVMQPKVLMLDDCTSQLDPLGAKEIFDVVSRLQANGMTIVCVDHDIERVSTFADRIMVMHEGNLRAFDRPEVILADEKMVQYGFRPHASYEIAKLLHAHGMAGAETCRTYRDLKRLIAG